MGIGPIYKLSYFDRAISTSWARIHRIGIEPDAVSIGTRVYWNGEGCSSLSSFASWLSSCQNAPDFGDEGGGRARFGHEPVAAGTRGTLQLACSIVRGERDDGYMCRARVVFQTPRRFPPVQNREAEIHQDDVGRMLCRMYQRVGAVARLNHVEP